MVPVILDYLGVGLFAASGALAASRKDLDIIGFVFLAGVIGIGGGTARDLILGVPVFWIQQPVYILVCTATAIVLAAAAADFCTAVLTVACRPRPTVVHITYLVFAT